MIETFIWSMLLTWGICLTANAETARTPQTSDSCQACSSLEVDPTDSSARQESKQNQSQLV